MLGDNIRKITKDKKISINKLSKATSISLGYLSDLENNKSKNPSFEKLNTIAKALGVPVNVFFDNENIETNEDKIYKKSDKDMKIIETALSKIKAQGKEEINLTDDEKNILNLYKNLNDKDKAKFEGMMELKISEYKDDKKIISSTCPSIGEEIS